MKSIIYVLISAILMFSIYGSFNLSLADFENKGICPKVLGIPACYIVLVFFLLALLTHIGLIGRSSRLIYYIFLSIPFILALSGTFTELSGQVVCPRTSGGTPMCYISLALSILLIILKIIETKLDV